MAELSTRARAGAMRSPRSLPGEHDRDRTPDLDRLTGRCRLAEGFVDPQNDHSVALFVCRIEKAPGGIEPDEARGAAEGRLPAGYPQRPLLRIDGEDGDAVVAAVGGVDETPVRPDRDLGRGAVAGEFACQRRHDLERREGAAFGVEAVGRDRAVEFVEHPHDWKFRMECEVARTGARPRLHGALLGRSEPAGVAVEAEYEDTVESLVRHQHKTAGRIEYGVVRMRTRLFDFVRTGLTRQLYHLVLVLERSVGRYRQHCDATARIVGHHQEFARWVDGLADAVLPPRRGTVEKLGLAGGRIEREGGGVVLVAVHRIEKALVRAQG